MHDLASSSTELLQGLYREHRQWLQGWAQRRTGCGQRAADLVQATFCRLLEHGTLRAPQAPRGFLATVARRLLVDDLRRCEIERSYLDTCRRVADAADLLSPERITEAIELLEGVLTLLAALPGRVRQAFMLRRIDGLSHEQIASEMGVCARSVKRYIADAYVQLYAYAYPEPCPAAAAGPHLAGEAAR